MRGFRHFLLAMVAAAGLLLGGCGDDNETFVIPSDGVGVVAFNSGWIGIINTATMKVSAPFLVGELGSAGGGSLDVVVTPDRSTALVSNFGDSTIYFVSLRSLTGPRVVGSVALSFFAEDIALTPDGRYALVTDGGFSPTIAVIDVRNRALVEVYTDAGGNSFQAVAVAADGQTVITVDYFGAAVNTLTIDDLGHLTYVGAIDVSDGGAFMPVNVSISPDGTTALVAGTSTNMTYPVLEITAPGVVALNGSWFSPYGMTASQSIVFNPQGTKAYALCTQDGSPHNAVVELNVTGPGEVIDAGIAMEVQFSAASQLFGVDTLAIDRSGSHLYVSNMSTSGAQRHLEVLDLKTRSTEKVIEFADVEVPPTSGTFVPAIPTGLFIR